MMEDVGKRLIILCDIDRATPPAHLACQSPCCAILLDYVPKPLTLDQQPMSSGYELELRNSQSVSNEQSPIIP